MRRSQVRLRGRRRARPGSGAGLGEANVRNGWSRQVPARRAMERDDEAVAGWVKEVWPCAEDSRRPVKPGWSSRTKPVSP
ncbi:winged helix-turn-helix domain-containing protein [Streptomyces virginiae]|uniref:winged helix-turn-helix domain-containing protein n=1 Tax=Streptomyces virginiae TaxID=1961 RepID=UPI00366A1F1F